MLEAELFALFEQTADAAYAVTEQGEICFWNGAAERLFGHGAAEVLHRSIDAYVQLDVRLARQACQAGDQVDRLNRELIDELTAFMNSTGSLGTFMPASAAWS